MNETEIRKVLKDLSEKKNADYKSAETILFNEYIKFKQELKKGFNNINIFHKNLELISEFYPLFLHALCTIEDN
jgi:hypothetical protein